MEPGADAYHWLMGPAGGLALRWATDQLQLGRSWAAVASGLRSQCDVAQTQVVLQQIAMRRRAATKFSRAAQMYFSPMRLEQATGEALAHYKATRLRAGHIVDLCCGIGGDLIGLQATRHLAAIDADEVSCVLAQANARVYDREVQVECRRVTGDMQLETDVWHIDPDRRPSGRRTTRLEAQSPSEQILRALLARSPAGAIKLAPAAVVPSDWLGQGELEWLGEDRECKQLVVWFGRLATAPGSRRATIVGSTGVCWQWTAALGGPSEPEEPEVREVAEISAYLVEPHAVVRAAGLTSPFAAEFGLRRVSPASHYLTGARPLSNEGGSCFEVLDILAYDRRRVRAALRSRGVGRLEFKARGTGLDPDRELQALQLGGQERATLIVLETARGKTACICRRVMPSNA